MLSEKREFDKYFPRRLCSNRSLMLCHGKRNICNVELANKLEFKIRLRNKGLVNAIELVSLARKYWQEFGPLIRKFYNGVSTRYTL